MKSIKKPLRLNGGWACLDCKAPVLAVRLDGRRVRPALRCVPCHQTRFQARRSASTPATTAVARAIKAGQLARPSTFACVDCAKPAVCYDHRDYTKPLQVEPVCRSCNIRRGLADVWPAEVQAVLSRAAA